ncbi:cysteine/Histidine-rich C1 domain family protein [Striga asiatica]|uniref:Cysteine/Histidine-rich C1 domain family protein n=1 Tax=Striga asiatica TaxID=4170 RepID=A0A5A7P1N8_STRAF|nr:cysteine/Histidine-rich C1 domain family protein [Striga asiatica]
MHNHQRAQMSRPRTRKAATSPNDLQQPHCRPIAVQQPQGDARCDLDTRRRDEIDDLLYKQLSASDLYLHAILGLKAYMKALATPNWVLLPTVQHMQKAVHEILKAYWKLQGIQGHNITNHNWNYNFRGTEILYYSNHNKYRIFNSQTTPICFEEPDTLYISTSYKHET